MGAGAAAALPAAASAETLEVNTLNSASADGTCATTPNGCSLADAIGVANGLAGRDQIVFSSSLSGSITPVVDLPTVTQALDINGPGAETLAISGGDARRILKIAQSVDVDIDGLTFRNGRSDDTPEMGAAIYALAGADLTIADSAFTDNKAINLPAGFKNPSGGAIYAGTDSRLEVSGSTFTGNVADGTPDLSSYGGAIASRGIVSISGSTLSGNTATSSVGPGVHGQGGAIAVLSIRRLTISKSTISGNQATGEAGSGGGLYVDTRKPRILSSTISGNYATFRGGGAVISGTGRISSSTIANNSAGEFGGGLYGIPRGAGGSAGMLNTIVADNSTPGGAGGDDIYDSGAIADFSLIEDSDSPRLSLTGSNNVLGVDPGLSPLADNGGPTQTHAIGLSSPAVDAGESSFFDDQRGVLRPHGGADDIGAFEFLAPGGDPSPKSVAGPSLTAPGTQNQHGKRVKIKLTAGAAEAVKLIARGRVVGVGGNKRGRAQAAGKKSRSFPLKRVSKRAKAGKSKTLRLTPKRKRDSKRIIKQLRRGKKLTARTSVKLTDSAGNKTVESTSVRLRAK